MIGVLILIIAMPTEKKQETKSSGSILGIQDETKSDGFVYDDMEQKVALSLADVEGIGKVRVILTYASKEEKVLPNVQGVLVVAEGGDNPKVIQNIKEAVQALFQVEPHKIKVMKMK